MDASLLASATTTAAAHTIAVATSTTVATTIGRSGQRNGTHRGAVNVHGRLMYDEIVINDVWINAILSTLALSCAACVCLCFLYCKIQQWKHGVQRRRNEKNSRKHDADSLPSYTIVTGLPTYDEALERMRGGYNHGGAASVRDNKPPPPPPSKPVSVSVVCVDDPTPPKPDPKFGLVSHSLFVHDDGCSHCLSVQELLETYNVR
ncbi:uncharacterized protein LOC114119646 isoform X2 [Aphis gossypii]|nr:uncharacterized protein LOC114119646 isoform X2 [Aphis gossypii]XP_027837075.2 uncharacterized protein LOC114119646 isoform X2 [Aphis gossypii]